MCNTLDILIYTFLLDINEKDALCGSETFFFVKT